MNQGLPWGESPIDLPEDAPLEVKFLAPDADVEIEAEEDAAQPGPRSGLGWVCGAMAVSTLALLGLNSHALANWADQLPVAAVTEPVVSVADHWHEQAGALGLNSLVDQVEAAARTMRKAPWPGSAPASPSAESRADQSTPASDRQDQR